MQARKAVFAGSWYPGRPAECEREISSFVADMEKKPSTGKPWVADFRDPILRNYDGLGWALLHCLFRRQLRSASTLVNVTPLWAQMDNDELARPTVCIPNGFDSAEFLAPAPAGGFGDP